MLEAMIAALGAAVIVAALVVRRRDARTSDTADWASRRRDVWARQDMRAALWSLKRKRGSRGSRRAETAWWIELESDADALCPCPKCALRL